MGEIVHCAEKIVGLHKLATMHGRSRFVCCGHDTNPSITYFLSRITSQQSTRVANLRVEERGVETTVDQSRDI